MSGTRIPALVALVNVAGFRAGDIMTVDAARIASLQTSLPAQSCARTLVAYGTQAAIPASSTGTTTTVTGGTGGDSTVSSGTGTTTTSGGVSAAAVAAETARAQAAEAALLAQITAATSAGSTSGTLAATGSGQSDAAALPYTINVVVSVPPGTGVVLSGQAPQTILNRGTNALLVYPPTGTTIAANQVNLPVQIVPGGTDTLAPTSPTQIYPE